MMTACTIPGKAKLVETAPREAPVELLVGGPAVHDLVLARPPALRGGVPLEQDPPDAGTEPADTAPPPDTDPPAVELVARLVADLQAGEFPLAVAFDGSGSALGSGSVRREWDFGDGAVAADDEEVVHTYVGEGSFEVSLTLTDESTGQVSLAAVTIEVDTPGCPREESPVDLPTIDDEDVEGLSGVAASRLAPDVYWIQEDSGGDNRLLAVDADGEVLSEQELPRDIEDIEDISTVIDALTGTPLLFLGDFGDYGEHRDEVAVWVIEEPDPWVDGELEPLRMELTYPDGAVDAETLLVDPLTMDLYILTKEWDEVHVFVKRAPHDDEGPFELEALGEWVELDFMASGGDVSPDGTRVVVRGYTDTARLWVRDGYRPLEDAFDEDPCDIGIRDEQGGEGIAFTADGEALVTVHEGLDTSVSYVEL